MCVLEYGRVSSLVVGVEVVRGVLLEFFFSPRQDGSFFAALWSSAGMSDACSGGLTLFCVDFLQR